MWILPLRSLLESQPQTLTATKFTATNSFGSPTALSVYALTPTNLVDADTFGTHTSSAYKTLLPGRFDDNDAFGSAGVIVTYYITPTILTNSNSFGNPTAWLAVQYLTATLYSGPDTFSTNTASAYNPLTGTLYSNTGTFGASVITTSYGLTHARHDSTNSFGAPVALAYETLTTTYHSEADTFGASSIFVLSKASPVIDITQGGWTDQAGGSSLYPAIDETDANDTDYIKSSELTTGQTDTCEIRLSSIGDAGESLAHFPAYRFRKQGSASGNLTVGLYDGATLIAEWEYTNVSSGWVTVQPTLTTAQANAISAYNNLRLRFVAEAA